MSDWKPDIEVGLSLARVLLDEQFGELRLENIEPLGTGWDNAAYLVNGSLVFRFPQRAIAVPIMEREISVLPLLAPRLPVPIPNPTHIGRPSPRYPWPFAGYPVIRGTTACRTDLRALPVRLAEDLARFLCALHSIPDEEASRMADPDRFGKLHLETMRERALARIEDAKQRAWIADTDLLRAVIALAPSGEPSRTTLCHGDLYARHLLLDEHGALSGIIDWGDLHAGDPAVDLSIAWMLFPEHARQHFFAAYGSASPREIALARLRALTHALGTLAYAIEIGDHDLQRACRFALDNVAGT